LAAPVGNTSTNLSFCPKAAMPALLPNSTSSRPSRLSRHRQRTTRQLARALRGAVALLPVAAAVQALPAMAQAQAGQSAARDYAIPAGPLGTVLSQFASQAGILLSTDAAVTAGFRAAGRPRAFHRRRRLSASRSPAPACRPRAARATSMRCSARGLQARARDPSKGASRASHGLARAGHGRGQAEEESW
jgi:hypothetical protein